MSLELETATPQRRLKFFPTGTSTTTRLVVLGVLALVLSALYLTVGVEGDWSFALERRGKTLATMTVVGVAIAVSTVIFHAVTANQILTPGVMGFDALYLLIQTSFVMTVGLVGLHRLDPVARFGFEVALMMALSLLLFRWLLTGTARSIHLLVLVGIVIGGVFRSLSTFLQRLMDPTQFIVLQDRFFADFGSATPTLLLVGAIATAVVVGFVWHRRHHYDVLALGRDVSTGLGLDHRRSVLVAMVFVSLLVAVSTALVGPTSFFGLLVAHLAYRVMGTGRHAFTIPAAALASVIALAGGQLLFERLLGFEGSLSMVVEFVGGIV